METRQNEFGETIYTFDEYPGLEVRPDAINFRDLSEAVPALKKHPKLVEWVMHLLQFDEVNRVHSRWAKTPGPEFVKHLIEDDFRVKLQVDNFEILERFKSGPYITVSNHPFGSLDGIALIYIVTQVRPEFKVMVNMILNKLTAMRPNFIAVDAWASDDPEKRRVSVLGIREALKQLKNGEPMGFFPAGAMSKTDKDGILSDRPWQPTILQLIAKAKVPVIPIYFHGNNSKLFNFLGHHFWQMRSAMLPRELFKKRGKPMRVTIGEPISVEKQAEFGKDYEALGWYLRRQTYDLSGRHITSVTD
ncbi:MAG: lysophospholipid acyltransferase family protein [Clostridium sp.]|nr:lysophospholipid acyltransferase family protein [Prevotella sp.]MCM1428438.1 lysophospholipid acyltransferase family protein [Clostridium sp.]MCM1474903.1 lysophospholipid acyltransferase family protein [Muribaculaceae bacterium]